MKPDSANLKRLLDKFSRIHQNHVFKFWEELDDHQRSLLLAQLETIDLQKIIKFKKLTADNTLHYQSGTLKPFDVIRLPETDHEFGHYLEAFKRGERLLKAGKVAVILVAGGQGSRLGYNAPKGTFPVGPVTDRSLFQYHVEKVRALENNYGNTVPFYIMTSETNHEQTLEFFKNHDYFGKNPSSFLFFKQGVNPALDKEHLFILAEKYKISVAPDGHGGVLNAILNNKINEHMKRNGIEYIFYFQVDNPLVQICDPAFLGYHAIRQSEMSAKTIKKRDPEEKLGNIGYIDDKVVTIEYSELSAKEKTARRDDGRLVFEQGSIAIHIFSLAFLDRLFSSGFELPYHVAEKSIPYIDKDGNRIVPEEKNGYKFEQFIFDAFGYANKVMVLETEREKEFSPIKNRSGHDSPATAKRDLSNLFAEWLERAGYQVPRDKTGHAEISIEISPLFADSQEEFLQKAPKNLKIHQKVLIE